MGMDLEPISPSEDAPLVDDEVKWGRYNWSGWRFLKEKLEEWGIDSHELVGYNDGEVISKETCLAIADAIEAHADELRDEAWLSNTAKLWRTCGGYRQY